jgi:AhpD family alkylhydroperoxidase
MEPRIDLMTNETGAKRFYNVDLAIEQSSLPRAIRDLVMLRVSQINGCGYCVDIHAKEAAAAGETAPAQPGRRLAPYHRVHRGRAGASSAPVPEP